MVKPDSKEPDDYIAADILMGEIPFHRENTPEVKDLIQNHRVPVDYSKMWPSDTPVLFVGEAHGDTRPPKEFIEHILPEAKKAGATHIAFELLNESDQALLDSYLAGQATREQMLVPIRKYSNFARDQDFDAEANRYLAMIDASHEAGLRVIAIDDLHYELHYAEGFTKGLIRRNANWVKLLTKTLSEQPSSRILVYGGKRHSVHGFSESANEQLKDKGVKSAIVHLVLGEEEFLKSADLSGSIAAAAVDSQHHNTQRFALDFRYMGEKRPIDYAVHLPLAQNQM